MELARKSAEAANLNSQSREAGLQQFGLRFGIVKRANNSTKVLNLETAEGQIIKDCVPVLPYPSYIDCPPPQAGSVVIWGFADGLAEQPFYLGQILKPPFKSSPSGTIKITGSQVQLNPNDKVRINGVSICVEGGNDNEGDIFTVDGQITPQLPS